MEKKPDKPPDKIAVIGSGRLGAALAKALYKSNYSIIALVDQNLSIARRLALSVKAEILSDNITDLKPVDIIFIAVPDDEITIVIAELKNYFKQHHPSRFVFHTSGALSSNVFNPLKEFGVVGASFHPIQTFTGKMNDWKKFQNIYFGLEGEFSAVGKASQIVKALKGHEIIIPKEHKSLYHLACTIASNYMISLLIPVTHLFRKMNFSEQETLKIIYPLLSTTLSNLKCKGIKDALTGPISRGDLGTIKKHLEILSNKFPDYKLLYQLHGKILLDLISNTDKLSAGKYDEIFKLLNGVSLEDD